MCQSIRTKKRKDGNDPIQALTLKETTSVASKTFNFPAAKQNKTGVLPGVHCPIGRASWLAWTSTLGTQSHLESISTLAQLL